MVVQGGAQVKKRPAAAAADTAVRRGEDKATQRDKQAAKIVTPEDITKAAEGLKVVRCKF